MPSSGWLQDGIFIGWNDGGMDEMRNMPEVTRYGYCLFQQKDAGGLVFSAFDVWKNVSTTNKELKKSWEKQKKE